VGKCKQPKEPAPSEILASLAAYLSFGNTLEDDDLLRLSLEIGVGMMNADEGSLLLLDRVKEELEFMMTLGSKESGKELKGQRFSIHHGSTGLAASTGEPQTGSPSYHGIKQPDRAEGSRREPTAVLAAPMLVDDEVVGVITAVSFQEGKTFSSGDVRLYCKFANLCGNVIRQRLREATVRNILLGDTVPEGAIPEIQRVLAHRARPFDRHRRNSRKPRTLSSGRDMCCDMFRTGEQHRPLAKELAGKPNHKDTYDHRRHRTTDH